MVRKVTVTLDEEILTFVDREATGSGARSNRSSFINAVLVQERRRRMEAELAEAYSRDAADPGWIEEAQAWDTLAGDGLGA